MSTYLPIGVRQKGTLGSSGPASAENMPKGGFSGRFGPHGVHAAGANFSQGERPLTIPPRKPFLAASQVIG